MHCSTFVLSCGFGCRNVKTKKNRKFREQVRSQASSSSQVDSSSTEPVVSKEDVHEAVVGLQLQRACVVRLVENEGSFADLVVCYTRAIADAPFKKDDLFSFHAECKSGLTKKVSLCFHACSTYMSSSIHKNISICL